jgi:hypothetical protein
MAHAQFQWLSKEKINADSFITAEFDLSVLLRMRSYSEGKDKF